MVVGCDFLCNLKTIANIFLLVLPIIMQLVLIDSLDHAKNINTNYAIIK